MARLFSSSFIRACASAILFVDSIRSSSFSFSMAFSFSAFCCLSFFCSSMAFASASSLLIFGFTGGGGAGLSTGKSMSASSECSASQFTACSRLALSVMYSAFSALSSLKPISTICFTSSWFTFSLISGGFGSPIFLSSGGASMTTSASASVIVTSPDPLREFRNSSVSLSIPSSSACSLSQASAASIVPCSLVKCNALAARTRLNCLAVLSISSFFWFTESRNLSFLLANSSFCFCISMR
mmetsp:Transcript_127595/g.272040  ORF Transcript_127595/g.272040 Transcript_127595/m.272040 type:complete len:241 (+) Transcript_127595:567-1289(+)